jgi:hypothetical protein
MATAGREQSSAIGRSGQSQTTGVSPQIERDRGLLAGARAKGQWATFKMFVSLSGPGWFQSGITVRHYFIETRFGLALAEPAPGLGQSG